MNVETIEMTPAAAREAFNNYQKAVRADRPGVRQAWKKEDEALMRGYKALMKGTRVLDIRRVMQLVGLRPDGYPKLAICRSHLVKCRVQMYSNGVAEFDDDSWQPSKRNTVRLQEDTFPRYNGYRKNATTLVPLVPPQLRPKHKIENYHTLWEVEEWKPVPPRDPMLLRHLGGYLYAVLAVWDLTDLERAVLGTRG
jgi:hypothetical protein